MPNWCSNQLYITGDRVSVADFIKRVTNTPEQTEKRRQKYDILQNLYPTPEALTNTISGFFGKNDPEKQAELEVKQAENRAKYGAKDWYDWNCNNWGTKWGDEDTDLVGSEGDTKIHFYFNSAWSPPIEGIAHISKMFPSLEFVLSYEEMGMGFYGLATFDDGCCLDDSYELESVEGFDKIDFDNDDAYEAMQDLLTREMDKLKEGVGL